jgi:hypothetical protein
VDTIMCRMEKCTPLWAGSISQVLTRDVVAVRVAMT